MRSLPVVDDLSPVLPDLASDQLHELRSVPQIARQIETEEIGANSTVTSFHRRHVRKPDLLAEFMRHESGIQHFVICAVHDELHANVPVPQVRTLHTQNAERGVIVDWSSKRDWKVEHGSPFLYEVLKNQSVCMFLEPSFPAPKKPTRLSQLIYIISLLW